MHVARCFLAASLIIACGGDDQPTVETEAMGIQAFAVASASGDVELEVTFTTAEEEGAEVVYASLDADDAIVASLGAAEITLREEIDTVLGLVRYTGSLASLGDRVLDIELRRRRGSNATSSVVIPSSFTVVNPPSEHARGAPLVVDWDVTNEVGTSRVLLAADCVAGSEVRIDADPGTATIPAEAFEVPPGGDPSVPCPASIQVDRLADGDADAIFGRGGRVEAAQTRSFPLAVIAPTP